MTYMDSNKVFMSKSIGESGSMVWNISGKKNQRTPSYNLLMRDCTEQVSMSPTIETKMQVNDLIKGWESVITQLEYFRENFNKEAYRTVVMVDTYDETYLFIFKGIKYTHENWDVPEIEIVASGG